MPHETVSKASSGAGAGIGFGNLLAQLPVSPLPDERFDTLWAHSNVRIERIVSTGQSSALGFWYDQPQMEWVLLVQGSATIQFEDEAATRMLRAGDYVYIAPHRRHRVCATQTDPATVWLAIHVTSD
jgi:cupin 2 domain-containing protein